MKILIFLLIIVPVLNSQLLYKINENDSIYIVDKSNKINLSNDKTVFDDGLVNYLYSDDKSLLLGRTDRIVNVSLNTESVSDVPIKERKSECTSCQNYIKVGIPLHNESILITCGAKEIHCRSNNETLYELVTSNLVQSTRNNNNNIPPFSYSESLYFFHSTIQTQDIFKQIYKINENNNFEFRGIVRLLNGIKNPNFRTSYGHEDKVYFFYSEYDISSQRGLSFKTYDSYIGEVCADDNGINGNELTKRFVTFKKTSINCYIPDFEDMAHTKYTEIQQATKPIRMIDETTGEQTDVFYAIFTSKRSNEIDSAVCTFKFSSIRQSMSGLFKNNQDKLPVRPLEKCSDYKNLTPIQMKNYFTNITKNYKYQMDEGINQRAFFALKNVKFTSLAIDQRHKVHIIYIGTSDGSLLKVINRQSYKQGHTQPIILSQVQVFSKSEPVLNVIVGNDFLVLVTEKKVKKVYIEQFCQNLNSCTECLQSEDPDCDWIGDRCSLSRSESKTQKCLNLKYEPRYSQSDIEVQRLETRPRETSQQFSLGVLFLMFLMTFTVSCLVTCTVTFYIIKKYYKLIEKNDEESDNRIMSFIIKNKNFRPTLTVKKKLLNCYETQPVVCVNSRPESTSDSPFILTSSSTQSNSPNFMDKNEIYSSDECFKDSNLIRIC